MALSDAVTEYLAVLDSGSYSSKRLANALDGVREALLKQDMGGFVGAVPFAKPATKKKTKEATKK